MSYIELAKDVFKTEISGMEEVMQRIDASFDMAIELIKNSSGKVVITGMGKSGLVGKKIAATFASTGTPSFFMHPGEAYHGDLGMIDPKDVVIAISNSGETEELIRLMAFFKDNQNRVIAMASKPQSTLAKYADIFLNIAISKEACPLELAPTTSTTVTLAMGDALAVALMKARNFKAENFARFHPGGTLGRKLLMKVKDVMKTKNLPVLKLTDSFEDIIATISSGMLGVGVILDNKKVMGVVTDGDIRRAIKNKGAQALRLVAGDFYTKNPITIEADAKIAIAEEVMQEKKVSALVVVSQNEFVGMLHRYDL